MLRGLTTVTYFAVDLDAAKAWYSELLGIEPYFQQPPYLEFRVGDYQHELGLLDARYAPHPPSPEAAGVVIYWAVDDVEQAFQRLLQLGATQHQGVMKRGEGFVTASVVDPFGNILGVMTNSHYQGVLSALTAG